MKNIFKHFRLFVTIISLSTLLFSTACQKEVSNTNLEITTTGISNITKATAVTGGKISLNGSDPITASGVCWSTKHSPTTADNKTSENATSGDFSSTINGLTCGTTYYVRAYITNSNGTIYGNEVSFLTLGNAVASKILFAADNNIYGVNINGSGLKQLTKYNPFDDHQDNGYANFPSWFPDGTKIAYVGTLTNNSGYINHGNIYIMNSDGSNQIKLTNETLSYIYQVSVSPDGTKILYMVSDNQNSDIYCINSDGTNKRNLTNHTSNESFESPSWFPDGKKIACTSGLYLKQNIYTMDADGNHRINVTNFTGNSYIDFPTVSPDGTKILFDHNYDTICSINSDGSTLRNLHVRTGLGYETACWFPDGKQIAYCSIFNIYSMKADGTNVTNIYSFPLQKELTQLSVY